MENVLLAQCEKEGYGDTLAACGGDSYGGLSTAQDIDLYTQRLTCGLSQVGKAGQTLKAPSDAAALLITAFPDLTTEQRTEILEQTATDSGYPLDLTADGGASRQRINLAAAMAAHVVVDADGSVTVTNFSDATKASVADADAISVGGRRDRRVRSGRVHVRRRLAEERADPGRLRRAGRVRRAGDGHRRQFGPFVDRVPVHHPHHRGDLVQRFGHPDLYGRVPAYGPRSPAVRGRR
jgi:hypothetical protein